MNPSATIALLGQPNSGKSTLFNALTGLRQHVGNWPGKTVEKKEGSFSHAGKEYKVADLPGSYSLSANSDEEVITRDYIASGKADIVCILQIMLVLKHLVSCFLTWLMWQRTRARKSMQKQLKQNLESLLFHFRLLM